MPVLDVPFHTQPTSSTCQSTCLKMMAEFLDRRCGRPRKERDIQDIYDQINTSEERPIKSKGRNFHGNIKWWLQNEFKGQFSIVYESINNEDLAVKEIIWSIDNHFPVMASTSHMRSSGHFILVIGYSPMCHLADPVGATTALVAGPRFVCHDPYGKFNPALMHSDWGPRRWQEGGCLSRGGEFGPGEAVVYDVEGIRRFHLDASPNTFYLLRPTYHG